MYLSFYVTLLLLEEAHQATDYRFLFHIIMWMISVEGRGCDDGRVTFVTARSFESHLKPRKRNADLGCSPFLLERACQAGDFDRQPDPQKSMPL
jgi:hypothetical protein